MVIYDLCCPLDHRFEGWFQSREDFAQQQQKEQLSCPQCGLHDIDKIPHASAMVRRDRGAEPVPASGHQGPKRDAAELGQQIKEFVHQIAARVRAGTEDVGSQFSVEAIRMHRGEKKSRPIRGTASEDQEKTMRDEQVPFVKVPMPKHDA